MVLSVLVLMGACAPGETRPESGQSEGPVEISFAYQKQTGYASNQFAVWIEDGQGELIKTLYASAYTAKGGYKNRPDSIPTWVEKSGLAAMAKQDVDAISGATPGAGTLTYYWDLCDAAGDTVAAGEYMFFIEGSLRWKNRVLYSGVISVGDSVSAAQAQAEYFYEGTQEQPALTQDAPENAMITNVAAYVRD